MKTIKNIVGTAFVLFASATACWALGLSVSSGGYSYSESSSSGSSSSGGAIVLGDEDSVTFSFEDDLPDEIKGYEVLTEFLPDGVALEWNGKKLKAPKSGKVKYSKSEESFVDTKDSENPAGLTVSYNKKKNYVKGSFKVYVAKSEKKLKSYKAKFSGTLGETMYVTVGGRRMATAVIQ